jgi:hypothetical protein
MPEVDGKKYPYTKAGRAAAKKAAAKKAAEKKQGKNPKDIWSHLSKNKKLNLRQAYETQRARTATGVRG